MNNFHIHPTHNLAAEAAPRVEELLQQGAEFVAIRGQSDGDSPEWAGPMVYGVWEAPHDHAHNHGYLWEYVDARKWLEAFRNK